MTIFGVLAVGVAGLVVARQPVTSQPVAQSAVALQTTQPVNTLPELSNDDATALVRSARRAMRARLLGKPETAATFHPLSLAGARGSVHLQLRERGQLIAEVESAEMDIGDAAVAAGTLLGNALRARPSAMERAAVKSGGNGLALVFEWMAPGEPLTEKFTTDQRWSDELLKAFDAGREGVGVRFGKRVGRSSVTEILASNYTPQLALTAAERAIQLTQADKSTTPDDITYLRFDTHVIFQKDANSAAAILRRGDVLVPEAAVDAATVDAAIERMGAYLRYRKNPDGWFTYEFVPAADRYVENDSPTPQVHALAALTRFARWTGQARDAEAARHGLDVAVAHLKPVWIATRADAEPEATTQTTSQPVPGAQGWVFSGPDQEKVLAATAWLALALHEGRGLNDFKEKYAGLIRAIQHAQDDEGRVEMLPARTKGEAAEDYAAAGLALRALSVAQDVNRTDQWELVVHRAYAYYRQRLIVDTATTKPDVALPDPESAMALVRGFAAAYPRTQDARQSELVFRVLDALCERQMTETAGAPELTGAFGARAPGDFGADTVCYLGALNDGVRLARQIGDARRETAYLAAIRRAVRFILQLEFRENGCFYVRSPQDVLGGIRTKPWDGRVRIDYCAEAVMALMDARVLLFGPRAGAGK